MELGIFGKVCIVCRIVLVLVFCSFTEAMTHSEGGYVAFCLAVVLSVLKSAVRLCVVEFVRDGGQLLNVGKGVGRLQRGI